VRRCAIFFVVAVSAVAAADPADHARAVKLFDEGRVLLNKHDAAGACAKFDEAIRLEPLAAGTMLNLGLCNEELGKNKTALYWFRKTQFRATETDPPMPVYEQAAREHTAKLATLVATVKIWFEAGEPQGAQVTIDGEPIKHDDYAHVEVDPGHHVLVAGALQKARLYKEFDVEGKGGQTLTLALVDGDSTIVVDRGKGQRRIALYVAIGAGALLGGSLGLTLYEKSVYNQYKAEAMQYGGVALSETQHATDVARTYGTGLAVAGVLAAGVASYLYFTAPPTERIERTVFVPTLAPDRIGLAATGSF
jgi:hypothetical protein